METIVTYLPLVLSGLSLTVGLALSSVVIAIAMGICGAVCKLSKSRVLRVAGGSYTTVVRGIPDLVLMLILYFGGQILVNNIGDATGLWGYVEISPFLAGTITIGIIFGAYMTETLRGAYLAIPKGQTEAAQALGLATVTYLRRIILPQIIPHALPGLTNNWLVLLKTTALVSIIGLHDVVYNANQAGRSSQEPFAFLIVAFFIFLGLTLISDFGLRKIARTYAAK